MQRHYVPVGVQSSWTEAEPDIQQSLPVFLMNGLIIGKIHYNYIHFRLMTNNPGLILAIVLSEDRWGENRM